MHMPGELSTQGLWGDRQGRWDSLGTHPLITTALDLACKMDCVILYCTYRVSIITASYVILHSINPIMFISVHHPRYKKSTIIKQFFLGYSRNAVFFKPPKDTHLIIIRDLIVPQAI